MSRRQRNSSSRSVAPKKKSSGKFKGLWWKVLLGVFVMVIVSGVVAYNKVIAFLHSDEFREDVAEQVSAELGTQGELGEFIWSGLNGENESFKATGDGFIESVAVEDISFDVDLDYIKRDKFTVSNISINSVEAEVDMRKPFNKIERPKKEKGFLESFLPEEVDITDAIVHNMNATAMTELGEFIISGLSVALEKNDDAHQITLDRGRINLPFPFLKNATLEGGQLTQLDDEIYIEGLKLNIFKSGEVLLNGDLDLSPRSSKLYDIDGRLSGLEVSDVFPKTWHQHLKGEVRGEFKIKPESGTEPKIAGHLEILNGQLRALPVLDVMAKYFSNDYQTINFQKFECNFSKFRDQYEIRELKLVSEGLVQVEGDLEIDGVNIDGVLNVGLPSENLSKLPGARGNVFKRGKEGLYWARIKIGGTLGNITNDLKDRLIKAAIDAGIEDLFNLGKGVLDPQNAEKLLNLAIDNGVSTDEFSKMLTDEGGGVKGGTEILKGVLEAIGGEGSEKGSGIIPKLPIPGFPGTDNDEEAEKPKGLEVPGIPELPIPELPEVPGIPLPF